MIRRSSSSSAHSRFWHEAGRRCFGIEVYQVIGGEIGGYVLRRSPSGATPDDEVRRDQDRIRSGVDLEPPQAVALRSAALSVVMSEPDFG